MGRVRATLKLRRTRRDLSKKKVKPLCDFCRFSRYGKRVLHQRDNQPLESQLDTLRILTRRLTCKDLHGLSFSELQLLESRLQGVLLIVKNQKKKIDLEEGERKQKQEAEDGGTRRWLLAPCTSSTISYGERQDDEAQVPLLSKTQREFERRNAESEETEFQRLWLLNERMNGRELDRMTSFDLSLLHLQILRALLALTDHKSAPRMEQIARQPKESSCHSKKESISWSAELEEDDPPPLPVRLLFASTKFRKLVITRRRSTRAE